MVDHNTKTFNCFGIPKELWSNNRKIDEEFENSELLYHRLSGESLLKDEFGEVDPSLFRAQKKDSFVRSRYADSKSACFNAENGNHRLNDHVVSLRVEDIRAFEYIQTENKNVTNTIDVKHDPLDCLYPHCEMHTYMKKGSDTEKNEIAKPSKLCAEKLRHYYSSKCIPEIENGKKIEE